MRPSGAPGAGLLVVVLTAAGPATGAEIVVGVLSPTGVGRAIGRAHEESVRLAFSKLGSTLTVGDRAVRLRVEYRSDSGEPGIAARAARALEQDGAVAIVGPVDSDAVRAVLDTGIALPVLAALSTAPELSEPRSPWFFRLTLSDTERVQQYTDWLQRYPGMLPRPLLVLYESSRYGRGLGTAVVRGLGLPPEAAISWSSVVAGDLSSEQTRNEVRAGTGFTAPGRARLDPPPASVFVLGRSTGAVVLAQGISNALAARSQPAPRYYFVGADSDLENGAPPGSFTIGEPTIVDAADTDVEHVRKEFHARSGFDRGQFVVTAYEAVYHVLAKAITAAYAACRRANPHAAEPSVSDLREALRSELESREFGSMEPWRSIRLRDGVLAGAPAVPIFRIGLQLVEVPVPQPWLKLDVPDRVGLLEGPVRIQVHPKRDAGDPVFTVLRDDAGAARIVAQRPSTPSPDGSRTVSFYPGWPGTYRLEAALPMDPRQPEISVRAGLGYPSAFIGALVGSLLVIYAATGRDQRVSVRRVVFGVLTGLGLAALAFNREFLPGAFPLPTFTSHPGWNAFWLGIAGGWFGPGVFLLLVPRLLAGLGELAGHAPAPSGSPPGSDGTTSA